MLRTIGDDSIDKLNVEETLSFICKLCERLLVKTGNIELEDRNVIKLSLSIFFSLLLVNVPLLQKSILSKEVSLLGDDSVIKKEGQSDLISFLLAGMFNKHHSIFSGYFTNAYFVCLRECMSRDAQMLLVQAVLNTISSESTEILTSKYIDVTCNILDYVCAEIKDSKLLIGKQDINSIINIEQLFFKLLDSILKLKDKADSEQVSEFIVSHFKVLSKILMVEPRLKVEISNRVQQQYVVKIFKEFVFNNSKIDDDDSETSTLNLNIQQIRNACY